MRPAFLAAHVPTLAFCLFDLGSGKELQEWGLDPDNKRMSLKKSLEAQMTLRMYAALAPDPSTSRADLFGARDPSHSRSDATPRVLCCSRVCAPCRNRDEAKVEQARYGTHAGHEPATRTRPDLAALPTRGPDAKKGESLKEFSRQYEARDARQAYNMDFYAHKVLPPSLP